MEWCKSWILFLTISIFIIFHWIWHHFKFSIISFYIFNLEHESWSILHFLRKINENDVTIKCSKMAMRLIKILALIKNQNNLYSNIICCHILNLNHHILHLRVHHVPIILKYYYFRWFSLFFDFSFLILAFMMDDGMNDTNIDFW